MNRYYRMGIISVISVVLIFVFSFISSSVRKKSAKKSNPTVSSKHSSRGKIRLPKFPYQDIIINNKVVKIGRGPNSETRYNAISKILSRFRRPITILDIGAAEGYMSLRAAHDFDATCVMVEHPSGESGGFLKELCRLNTDCDNLILLFKLIAAEELQLLSRCEHFDVVIALNVLHHFALDKWEMAANAILDMADYAIIETPPANDKNACGQKRLPGVIKFLEEHDGKIIGRARRHTSPNLFANIYLLKGRNKGLGRRGVLNLRGPGYEIHSDLQQRYLVDKSSKEKLNFPKGINLTTFKTFNGVYPSKRIIKESLDNLRSSGCSLVPQEIVIQGKNLVSISKNKDPKGYDEDMLKRTRELIDASHMNDMIAICRNINTRLSF